MKRIAATVIALSLFSTSAVMAKDHRDWGRDQHHSSNRHSDSRYRDDHHRGYDRDRHDRRRDHRPDYRRHDYYSRNDHRRYYGNPYPRFHAPAYRHPYGYRDSRRSSYRWHRGDYLPRAYCGRGYWVTNYSDYRLRPPPYGYHWVRVNNDVLLTAIATGIVLDVMYDHFW